MTSHGHVIPNANGLKARCGGPAICAICQKEFFSATTEQKQAYLDRQKIDAKNVPASDDIPAMEGKRAWREGKPITSNPYQSDSSMFLAWQHAYLAANSAYLNAPPKGM